MTWKLYGFNFMVGAINSIITQMLPLVFIVYGYNEGEISTLLSLVFFASLFQPIIGRLTSKRVGTVVMIITLLGTMALTSFILFYTRNIYLVGTILFIYSIARLANGPLNDSLISRLAVTEGVNYGFVRSGASLGYGMGMMIFTFLAYVFTLNDPASFILITILNIIAFAFIFGFKSYPLETKATDQKTDEQTNWTKFIILTLIYMLYFGGLTLRVTYLSTYYVEFGYDNSFISLTTLVMVIPEVLLMPLYNRLFGRFNKILLVIIAVVLGIIQMLFYTFFTASPALLIFTSLFNGFQIMIFLPTFASLLQSSLGHNNSSFGFMINATIQSLFVATINQFVIKKFYVATSSTIPIFYIICILMILSLVPVFIYHFKYKKNS